MSQRPPLRQTFPAQSIRKRRKRFAACGTAGKHQTAPVPSTPSPSRHDLVKGSPPRSRSAALPRRGHPKSHRQNQPQRERAPVLRGEFVKSPPSKKKVLLLPERRKSPTSAVRRRLTKAAAKLLCCI